MEHIDKEKLQSDLEYRFKYVASFLEFGEKDIELVKGTAANLAPLVPGLVEAVYTKLFKYDITKQYFLVGHPEYAGSLVNNVDQLNPGSEQMGPRRDFLSRYLVKLVTGEYDTSFLKYLDHVGKYHTAHSNRKIKNNVDYIHIGVLLGWVETQIVQAIRSFGYPADKEIQTIAAFNKLVWIQNDLFTRWYIDDGADGADGAS